MLPLETSLQKFKKLDEMVAAAYLAMCRCPVTVGSVRSGADSAYSVQYIAVVRLSAV